MFKLLSIIFFCFFVHEVVPQIIINECPKVEPLTSFNVSAFMGRWYKNVRYPNYTPILNDTRCSYGDYSVVGKNILYDGFAIMPNSEEVITQLVETLPYKGGALFVGNVVKPNYFIRETDYTNYAVVYTCEKLNEHESSFAAWAETRTRFMSEREVAAITKSFEGLNVDPSELIIIDQDNCPEE